MQHYWHQEKTRVGSEPEYRTLNEAGVGKTGAGPWFWVYDSAWISNQRDPLGGLVKETGNIRETS